MDGMMNETPPMFYRTLSPLGPLPCLLSLRSCKRGQRVSLTTYCPWATCFTRASCMEGRTDRQTGVKELKDGWTNGQIHKKMDGLTDGWIYGRTHEQMDRGRGRWMDGGKVGQIGGRSDGRRWMDRWTDGNASHRVLGVVVVERGC